MEKTFRYPRSELLGTSIADLFVEPSRTVHSDCSNAPMTAVEPGVRRELCGRHKNGTEFPVEITTNPIETDVGSKVLSAIVDITDRRQKEMRIESAFREKDVLLGEIHHRVKNNLQIIHSLLELQCSQIQDAEVLAMLRDSQNRIRSMALIHQTLYQSNDFGRVDFGIFLNSLVPTLINSYLKNPERIALSIHSPDIHLPINAAVPCGLLVNELISNCLKHAFPQERRGQIDISFLHEPDDFVVLTVADNGVGIAENFELTETTSLGLQLVFLLAEQLHGSMTVRRSDPTSFELRFSTIDADHTAPAHNAAAADHGHSL
jgi:PAS domain S-box-containing protein